MKLETDLKRIKKLAGEREDENIRFRTFLKSSDSEELDVLVHSLSEEISKQIDCCSCGRIRFGDEMCFSHRPDNVRIVRLPR